MPKKKYNVKITEKQKTYIDAVLDGYSKVEAYKMAYDTSKMQEKTIKRKAYELFKNELVQAEYLKHFEELNKEAFSKCSYEYITKIYDDLIMVSRQHMNNKGLNKTNSDALIRSLDRLVHLKIELEKLGIEKAKVQMQIDKQYNESSNMNKWAEAVRVAEGLMEK